MVLAGNSFKIYEGAIIALWIIVIIATFYYKPQNIKFNKNIILSDLLFTGGMILFALVIAGLAIYVGLLKVDVALDFKGAIFTILLLALVMAPAEEIVFRGFIGEWLNNNLGIILGVLLTSLIFGLAHLPKGLDLSIMAFIGGLFFSIIYFNTSSIINPMIAHTVLGFLYFLFR